jgi:undecaprenyl-diphosphatase
MPDRRAGRAEFALGASAVLLTLLTIDVLRHGPTVDGDARVMLWIDSHQQPAVRHLSEAVSRLGSVPVAATLLALAVAIALSRERRQLAVGLLATATSIAVLGGVLRVAVGRTSPTFASHVHAGGTSYPSGHVLLAATALGALAAVAGRLTGWIVAGALVVLVSVSRVYDFTHFPTDIAAAWLVVAVCALSAQIVSRRRGAGSPRTSSSRRS